jgi:hypothetical protein
MAQEIVIRVVVEQPSQPAPISPADDFVEVKGKEYTPSQQLRLALRRRHLAAGGTDEDFEPMYKREMARIISVIDKKPKAK